MRGFANRLILANSNKEDTDREVVLLGWELGHDASERLSRGERADWQGVENKVIGRWKASRQKMEVEHVRFFLCDAFS